MDSHDSVTTTPPPRNKSPGNKRPPASVVVIHNGRLYPHTVVDEPDEPNTHQIERRQARAKSLLREPRASSAICHPHPSPSPSPSPPLPTLAGRNPTKAGKQRRHVRQRHWRMTPPHPKPTTTFPSVTTVNEAHEHGTAVGFPHHPPERVISLPHHEPEIFL